MARVTVEDCIQKIPNRFELVLLAAHRSRQIAAGSALTISRDNDKNPVISLREIAEESVPLDQLRENLIKGMQRHIETDEGDAELDSELQEALQADQAWNGEVSSEKLVYEEAEMQLSVVDEEMEGQAFAEEDSGES